MKKIFAILIVVIVAYPADKVYSASYLMLNPFPELDAMGGSLVSLYRGSGSYMNNPALRDTTRQFGAAISQTFHFEDERQSGLAISGSRGQLSGALYGYIGTVSDIPYRTAPTADPIYYFNADQTYAGLAVNYTPVKRFSIGGGVKWIHESINTSDMNATAYDIGAQFRTKYAALGVSVRNIGDKVSFEDVMYELPMTYTVGVSSQWKDITGELTFVKPDLMSPDYNIGVGWKPSRYISLAGGLVIGHDTRLFSLGTTISNWGLDLSYSVTPYRKGLGTRHSISLSI